MAQVKDRVCGMTIEQSTAKGQSTHKGQLYYFCSEQCKRQFDQSPEKFVEDAGPR